MLAEGFHAIERGDTPPSRAPRATPPLQGEDGCTHHSPSFPQRREPSLHLVRKANDKFDFRPCLAIHRRHPSEGWDITSSNEAPETKERSQLPLG